MKPLCPLLLTALAACAPSNAADEEPFAIRLAETFEPDDVTGSIEEPATTEPMVWRFDGPPPEPKETEEKEAEEEDDEPEPDFSATYGFEPFVDVEDLAVEDGKLVGKCGEIPVLRFEVEPPDADDVLHSVEVRLRVSDGAKLGLMLSGSAELKREELRRGLRRRNFWLLSADVESGEEMRTVTVSLAHAPSRRVEDVKHVFLQPTDAAGATFAIEEVRFVSRREHLATIPSGVSWQGLADIYREALVLRAPESASFETVLPSVPWLDLSIGTIEAQPVTFRVVARLKDGEEISLLRRTVTTPDRWETVPLDLARFADRRVELRFSVESEVDGSIGFFGTPVVRNPVAATGDGPRHVIFILADTLRRDHLDFYGYERATSPALSKLAGEGAVFLDNISQGAWTKVSVTSMLTSLYPTTLGITSARDRLPGSVTTLAEVFQEAGYATFATSSVFFTGKLSNLQQGVDVLHEKSSVPDPDHSSSKTARVFVDRLTEWIEAQRGGPFFAFLHVFDPHSPFPPYAPYDRLWSEGDARDAHDEALEEVYAWQKEHERDKSETPKGYELDGAGVDSDAFVARERNWYDESIRAMDAEIARLVERLEELGLMDDTLIAFISDHGEEFLEHGRQFHGNTTYGEMTNVPLFVWGPRWVPSGRIAETVQSIDLMPTVVELAGLSVPDGLQGQSLAPLIQGRDGWTSRPAFSERRRANFRREPEPDDSESFSIVLDGWRLVHNFTPAEGKAEYELFDHEADPLNLNDLAAEKPEVVQELAKKLDVWSKWVETTRLEGGEAAELSPADLAELQALGYAGD